MFKQKNVKSADKGDDESVYFKQKSEVSFSKQASILKNDTVRYK